MRAPIRRRSSCRAFCIRLLAALFLTSLVTGAARSEDDNKKVKVEFLKGQTKLTPGDPTINLAASPSVLLEVLPGESTFEVTADLSTIAAIARQQQTQLSDIPGEAIHSALEGLVSEPTQGNLSDAIQTLGSLKADPQLSKDQKDKLDAALKTFEEAKKEPETTSVTASSNRFLLNFHRGWWWEYHNGPNKNAWKRHCSWTSKGECEHVDFVEKRGNSGFDVYLINRTHSDAFRIMIKCTANCTNEPNERLLVIYIDSASFAPTLSAGVIFPDLRDERYAVNGQKELVRLPDGGVPYYASTLLHYCPINGVPVLDAFCPTLAIATQVPADGVVIGLGLAGRLKPLETVNAAYFSFGASYGPHKVLSDTYRGKSPVTVPDGTNIDDILKTRYAFKFFAGVSIGIADGIEKFRGVFPGTKGDSSKTESAGSGKEDTTKDKPKK
jgi:hypothetical protein